MSKPVFEEFKLRGKAHSYYMHALGRPRFNEIDHYGVVWNGHFVNYFETGRLALCKQFGFDMELLSKLGLFLPVYKYEVTMTKPVLPTDEMTVAVRATELSESAMIFSHLLIVGGEARAIGTVQHIAMSKETGSIAFTLSDEAKKVLEPIKEAFGL